MNFKLSLFVLVIAVAGYAQHGRPAGAGAGGGMGHSSMGMSHSTPDSISTRGNEAHSPTSLLQTNNQLNTHLSAALTKSGVTLPTGGLQTACAGFKNLGQCVAALHVSNNLKIGFGCLKADLTGQAPTDANACPSGTGSSKMSMGKAITRLQPSADAEAEVKKAKKQASQDLSGSES